MSPPCTPFPPHLHGSIPSPAVCPERSQQRPRVPGRAAVPRTGGQRATRVRRLLPPAGPQRREQPRGPGQGPARTSKGRWCPLLSQERKGAAGSTSGTCHPRRDRAEPREQPRVTAGRARWARTHTGQERVRLTQLFHLLAASSARGSPSAAPDAFLNS